VLLPRNNIWSLLDDLSTLHEDKLNVAWVAHVRVDTAVSTVCASSLLWCLIDLDVLDDEVAGIEALGVGVGFGVLEETEEEVGGLDGPAGLGDAESLALSGTASAASISPHWDSLLVLLDVLEKLERAVELPAIDGLRSLAGVFVRDTEVRTSSAGALAVVDGSCGV